MINKEIVKELVNNFIAERDIFLVDVKVSTTNRITILVNKPSGITIDECAMISRHIETNLDRNREDYDLNVSSPGLNMPFRVREQYEMSIGRPVEVIDNQGKKTRGILLSVEGEGFEIESEKTTLGKKKVTEEISFNFDEIKTVKEVISFK
ncbi:MAG: ribosome assembly cofactor RimP [Bacteroidales bacterium]|nr:ribosome assembly cofactor RimP [Bacteroidales bacterium]